MIKDNQINNKYENKYHQIKIMNNSKYNKHNYKIKYKITKTNNNN